MRWAIAVVVLAGLLFAANFVFIGKRVAKAPPPRVVAPAPDAPAPAPATAVLTGRVLTAEEGKPVAGAVIDYDDRRPFVRSGPDGSYRLEGIAPGRHSIGAFPEEFAYGSRWLEFTAGQVAHADLFVLPGASIEGKVVADGGPVAGATVSVYEGTKSVTTGKDGTFILRGFRPQSEFLEVAAAGFLPQTFCVEVPPGEERVPCTLDLRYAWKVVGTVVREGKPVAGARVAATSRRIAGKEFEGATTAADGTFVLVSAEELDDGVLWAWKEGMGIGCSAEIDLEDAMTHDGLAIALPPIRTVPIALVDEAGKPVAGAAVEARQTAEATQDLRVDADAMDFPGIPDPVRTDAEGKAVLALPAGRWEVGIRADGFFAADLEFGPEDPAPPMPLVLRRGGDLEVRIVDGAGRPVEGAGVRIWVPGPWDNLESVTGQDGRLLFRALPDADLDVLVEKAGFSGGPAENVRPGKPVTLTLLPASTVRGRVRLPESRGPARAFTIRLYYRSREDGSPWPGNDRPFFEDDVVDPEGRFAIPDVEPGTIEAEAECGALLSRRVPVVTRPGADPAEVELALSTSASLAARVLDAEGKPVAGAPVLLMAPEQVREDWPQGRTAEADAEGRFRFLVLPAGRRFLRVEREGFFRLQVPVEFEGGAATKRDLVLLRGGEIVLETADAAGEYVTWDSLEFLEEEGTLPRWVDVIREMWEGSFDRISMGDLHRPLRIAAGSYRALLTAEDCVPVEVRFVVKEGETTTVKAVLKKSP